MAGPPQPVLPNENMHPVTARVLRVEPKSWLSRRSAHFTLHTRRYGLLRKIETEAELFWRETENRLSLQSDQAFNHIVVLESQNEWRNTLKQVTQRPASKSFSMEGNIFLLRDPRLPRDPADLAHEIVHAVVWHHYRADLPLWLEEGLSLHVSTAITRELSRSAGIHLEELSRPLPPGPGPENFDVTAWDAYPPDLMQSILFYRCSRQLVRSLADTIGDANLGAFVKAVHAENGDWRSVLQEKYGVAPDEINTMLAAASRVAP